MTDDQFAPFEVFTSPSGLVTTILRTGVPDDQFAAALDELHEAATILQQIAAKRKAGRS